MMEIRLKVQEMDALFMKFYYIKENSAGGAPGPTTIPLVLSQGETGNFALPEASGSFTDQAQGDKHRPKIL